MVSDHEHNWGPWGRMGVTCSGLRSSMVSDHERNCPIGAGCVSRARACGLPWSPIMSTIGAGRVSLPWSPIMSTIGAGVTRFGPCHAVQVSMVSEATGVGRVSRAWVRGLPGSPLMSEMVRVRDHSLRS